MDSMTPHLDAELKEPLYFQLYAHIKNEILNGRLQKGEKLPSKRKLSAHLDVSRNTVQAAYDQLTVEGYAHAVPKSGYYVNALEELVRLDIAPGNSPAATVPQRPRFDFSPGGVDLDSFPFKTWRRLNNEVIDERDSELLLPGDPQGHPALRAAIADYLHQSRGVVCSAAQILVSSGTEYLLQLLIQLIGKGSVFALENPGYEKVNLIFESNGLSFVPVPLDDSGMSFPALAGSEANVAYVTPSHQFPTGVVMPIQRRMQILNWAHEIPERYIVEDDYDSEFRYSGKPIPAMQGIDKGEKVIYLGSFSKSLTSGLRISYMVLPPHLLDRYRQKLSFYICPVPTVEQKCLSLFIERGHFERHLNRMRTIYRKKREFLVEKLADVSEHIAILGENAGLHLYLRISNGISERQLVERAFAHGIKVRGASRYFLSRLAPSLQEPAVLLSYAALTETEIDEAALLLKRAWF